MPKTIELRNDVFITGSVACDEKKLREYFRANKDVIIKAFDVIKKKLKVDNYEMLINNIRGSVMGRCVSMKKQIQIDLRSYNIASVVSCIIHELTHAQQFNSKKLVHSKNKNKMIFDKKEYTNFDSKKDHDKYLNLPWEIEARKAEEKYLPSVLKELNIKEKKAKS